MSSYTERFEGLQIRDPVYIGSKPANAPISYDIVKFVQTEPREVIDGRTGKKENQHGVLLYCWLAEMGCKGKNIRL